MAGWSDSAYCSGPKAVEGAPYNYTLEHPDLNGLPCLGPRDHIRIWDMGYDPTLGQWSIASVHHEHTICNPSCHHVIDSWNNAEADAVSPFVNGQATVSISNDTLGNAGFYQNVYYNGNATVIKLRPPSTQYPVVFNENGLGNRTLWAVTVNDTTASSTGPAIVFEELDGTYSFNVSLPKGFNASPTAGNVIVKAGASETIQYRTPWTRFGTVVKVNNQPVSLQFNSNVTVGTSTIQEKTGDVTAIAFTADVIGTVGAVNVTIPESITPPGAIGLVYVNGSKDNSQLLTSDPNNYYFYFLIPFGAHSITLQLERPPTSYLEYVTGAAIAALVLSVLVLVFRSRKRKRSEPIGSIMLNNQFWRRCALFSP
jgi:hypothetical protein